MNDGRGARVQTRLDATSPILHGNLAHIFRAGSKVWAAGGEVLQWSGASWAVVPAPAGLYVTAMSGSLADGLWVAGGSGFVLRYLR